MTGRKVPKAPSSFQWLGLPAEEGTLARAARKAVGLNASMAKAGGGGDAPMWQCLGEKDPGLTAMFASELLGEWPTAQEKGRLDAGVGLIGHCSEMMLFPPGALVKGATYAEELEEWAKVFPRSSLKVIHTDELSAYTNAQRIMDDTFAFLGLPKISIGNETRMCVHGKAGVMDVLNQFEGSVRIGTKGVAPDQLNVGRCDGLNVGMHRDAFTGALHHDISPALTRRMREYYEPANQRLYRFLGRDLGW